jgi:hypothetical protein
MLDNCIDRLINKRSALPDFTLDNDVDPKDIYCLMTDIEDERASTDDKIAKGNRQMVSSYKRRNEFNKISRYMGPQ